MPNSLRARLKKLVHKGELSEKDLERIIIRPANNKSSNDDYISRQEAIDLFKNDEDADYCKWSTKGIISELEDLPSANFVSRWISVDDRLPEQDGKYLVTLHYSTHYLVILSNYTNNLYEIDEYEFSDKHKPGWYNNDTDYGYYEQRDVSAWMACPKTYNGG